MSGFEINNIKEILYDNCSVIALVSDDEFIVAKDDICGFNMGDHVSIYGLFASIKKFIHSGDSKRYDYIFDTERVARIINDKSYRCIDPEFQLKVNGSNSYQPYQFTITRSSDYAIVTIKQTDRFYNILENAMRFLSCAVDKILKVNITDDTYKEIKVRDNSNHPSKLSDWMEKFAKYNIAEDDQKYFLDYWHNLGNISADSEELPKPISYRRCVNSAEYRWSIMFAVPTNNFTEDNKEMYLYVIDVHWQYITQVEHERELGIDEYYDKCGLQNKKAFQNRIVRLKNQRVSLGYLCLDDELPEGFGSYDEYVESVVDEMVLEFGEDKCYRISDKEFVVLSVGTKSISNNPVQFDNVSFGTSYSDGMNGYGALYDNAVSASKK